MDKKTEKRSFRWQNFICEVELHYNKQSCDFELEIGADVTLFVEPISDSQGSIKR